MEQIDLKKGTLGLDDSPTDSCHEGVRPVRVKTTCVIPPSSETILPASLDADFPPGKVGFLGASPHLREPYQLQGVAALVTVTTDHTVPFRLINPTCNPDTLYRGSTLGTFTPAEEDAQVLSLDEQSCRPKPFSLHDEDVPVDLSDADLTEEQKQGLLNEYCGTFSLCHPAS